MFSSIWLKTFFKWPQSTFRRRIIGISADDVVAAPSIFEGLLKHGPTRMPLSMELRFRSHDFVLEMCWRRHRGQVWSGITSPCLASCGKGADSYGKPSQASYDLRWWQINSQVLTFRKFLGRQFAPICVLRNPGAMMRLAQLGDRTCSDPFRSLGGRLSQRFGIS